jgi:hypothetical protein
MVAHFGLGDATNVDTVRIEWPSGIIQTLTNIAPRQILSVVETQITANPPNPPKLTVVPSSTDGSVSLTATGDSGLLYVFEGSSNLSNWTWLGVRSNATGSIQFTNMNATNFAARFYRVSIP